MTPQMGKRSPRRRGAVWLIAAGFWIAAGYIGANSYALQLGAAHHDAFCTEH